MKFSRGIHRGGQRLRHRRQGLLSGGPRGRLIGRRWSAGGGGRLIGRRGSAGGGGRLIGRRGFVAACCRLIGRLSSGRGHVVLRLFAVVGCRLAWRLFIGRSCGGGGGVLFGARRAEGGNGGQRHGAGGRNGGPRKACKRVRKDNADIRSDMIIIVITKVLVN
jgi:hypothetical protein